MAKFILETFFVVACLGLLVAVGNCNVLRCDLIDPHSPESELCWKQLLYKSLSLDIPQLVQETVPDNPDVPLPVHARNAELSSALMQLYGFNKLNGKRNPTGFSRDVMRYISEVGPTKAN
ncbi:uncharacterized protein LOC126742091 [Anthonomus grandis grandis]|uniref:uncharacterized protein LOC126742091 n=1 Tax=Anthonomus grandis grandis TaxID=2921223 RepID=UPI002166809F|nr:uncharacterized protein LOC126742091 [Anthonomus grandis grandis]